MSDSDSKESLSNASENSFIILDPGSWANQACTKSPTETSDLETLVSSKSTTTCGDSGKSREDIKCSFSEGSIQEKLNELVKENYQLKETLSQNNLAIKSQLDTFFMWQQEVLKTHEAHKQKFLETKDLILKLRMENLSLKKQLEGVSSGFSVMSIGGDTPGQGNNKLEDSDKLRERIKEFENICDGLANKNENLDIENQKLCEELAGAKKEILKLKKDLEDVVVENMFLKQWNESSNKNSDESMSHKSLPNAEARTQISNLFKQLEEEKSKVLKLKEALKEVKSNNKGASDANTSTTDELSQSVDKLSEVNNSLNPQNQRISGFHSWVSLAEGNLKENQSNEEVDCKLKEFKSYLNLEGDENKEKQDSVQAMKKQFTELLDDYKILQQQFNVISSKAQNIDKFKEEIHSLSLELQSKDNELISKQRECDDLKEELRKTNAEWSEKVDVLQVQAELFRSDFDCEREAREKLVGEKERMAEEIRLFQSQIKEFEKLNSQGNGLQDISSLASPERKESFKCPQCLSSFSNLKSCEEHVDDCLDTLMYP